MQTNLIRDVENVAEMIHKASIKLNVSPQELEINLQSFKNYVKNKDSQAYVDVDNAKLDDDSYFDNQDITLKQTYDFSITKIKYRFFDIKVENNFENVILVLFRGFKPPKTLQEIETLINEINSLKVLNGIFLRKIDSEKNKIIEEIKSIQNILQEDVFINLSNAPSFRNARDGEIKFVSKNIDMNKKNIICVKANTKICEFHLSTRGNAGRNLAGIYIIPQQKVSTPPTFGENIIEIQKENYNEYLNKDSGFVIFENNNLSFCTELNLVNVQIRDNYHFSGDIDSNTTITISTKSEFEDALKNGVSIMANKIIVNGNIGAKTIIKANELQISGQSHKDSIIFATKAMINVHKGTLESSSAKINSFESAEIKSEDVEITKVNGGIIESKNINIIELYSNSSISFSNKCVINSLKGGGNKIIFTPLADLTIKEKITELMQNLSLNKDKQKALELQLKKLIYKYNKYKDTAQELKQIIQNDKEKNQPTKEYVLQNYNSFLQISKSIQQTKLKMENLNNEIQNLSNNIKEYQKSIFDAEFLCKDGWLKYNDVIFTLIVPKVSTSKTIIKGIGRYYFSSEEKRLIHQKIFKNDEDETINNQGF
ncbi:MAG: FapA family protein [Helicobacteraceae bacterium]|nr:FapA family protein [Helicobacteraceae bacterium]